MKRLLPLLLIFVLLLAACGSESASPDPTQAPQEAGDDRQADAPEETPADKPEEETDTLPPEQAESTPAPALPGGDGPDEDELPLFPGEEEEDGALLSDTQVTLNGLSSYLRVTLPEGWTWEQAAGAVDCTVYGLWAEGDPDFKVELRFWPEKFAMCGTGVTFQDYTLPDGQKASLAYERIGEDFTWILILPESPDSFTVQFTAPYALYEAHRAELELLLGTIRQGVLAHPDVVTPETSAD